MDKVEMVLLSGGSGTRLWPLSNGVRSKQFLKLLDAPGGGKESMVQRIYRQIRESKLPVHLSIVTSLAQRDPLINQLGGGVEIIAERPISQALQRVYGRHDGCRHADRPLHRA